MTKELDVDTWLRNVKVVDSEPEDTPNSTYWTYRVIHRVIKYAGYSEDSYGIYEVYYTEVEDGEDIPNSCTVNPVEPHGETLEELRQDVQRHLDACSKPVLEYSLFDKLEKKNAEDSE